MLPQLPNLALTLPPFIEQNLPPFVAGAIVLLGLVIYGLLDLVRFSWMRTWAISGVCFQDAIRKRVWLIVLLAIPGSIAVVQLQHPIDEADAIRQTLKICLFATGLVITVTAIILACTNLPKEIDNRVIFTVVTKPTTRLEIIFGKIIGFARVSALLVLVMGAFIYAYVHLRAWNLQRNVENIAQQEYLDPAVRSIYTHYQSNGLLQSRTLTRVEQDVQVYSRISPRNSPLRYMGSIGDGDMIMPFRLSLDELVAPGDSSTTPGAAGVVIALRMGFQRNPAAAPAVSTRRLPIGVAAPDAVVEPDAPLAGAKVQVQVLNNSRETLITHTLIPGASDPTLPDASGRTAIFLHIPPEATGDLTRYLESGSSRIIYVHVTGQTPDAEYIVPDDAVELLVPPVDSAQQPRRINPPTHQVTGERAKPILRGRLGREGQQIAGVPGGGGPVAVFSFSGAPPLRNDAAQFEIITSIERGDGSDDTDPTTRIQATVVNHQSGAASEPVEIAVESLRTAFFSVPAQFVEGGGFDVQIRSITKGHYCGFYGNSLSYVSARGVFDLNLLKSLTIIWLMSLLVVTASIFCSTFLSWPIAVVLTLLILLGHWGVQQLGDTLQPGIGAAMATDMGLRDPGAMRAVSQSVEALAKLLNFIGGVLPDISRFSATEDIERGISIPAMRFADSFYVLGCYALPMAVLAYVLLRKKEVAP